MIRYLLFALAICSLSSCYQHNDYTCVCKSNNQIVEEKPYMNITEKNAKKKCQELNDSYQPPAGSQYLVYTSCSLNQ